MCLFEREVKKEKRESGRRECILHISTSLVKLQSTVSRVQPELVYSAPWNIMWVHGGRWGGVLVRSVCPLWLCLSGTGLSLPAVWLFHLRDHGCFGLSSFIKGSAVSESLWCFLSRGGSTLLQRVHDGERMYPPLGSTGWCEPESQINNDSFGDITSWSWQSSCRNVYWCH